MSIKTIKCPNCGAPLKFDPSSQNNKCEFCLSEFTNEELSRLNKDVLKDKTADIELENFESSKNDFDKEKLGQYICDSCGAEVVTDKTTATTFCYYCHSPVILQDRLSGEFKPKKIISFKIPRKAAQERFKEWVSKYKFVPKTFISDAHLEMMTGLYVPNWMINTKARVSVNGEITSTTISRNGNYQTNNYKEYTINRKGRVYINNIKKLALKKIDRDLIESIDPYNYKEAVDFDVNYLNGFFAEKYDIAKEEFEVEFRNQAKNFVERKIRADLSGYSSVKIENDINIENSDFSYTLLPVWILTYKYMDKIYIYALNGQTGKAFGELPLDKNKLIISSMKFGFIVLTLLLLGGRFIW